MKSLNFHGLKKLKKFEKHYEISSNKDFEEIFEEEPELASRVRTLYQNIAGNKIKKMEIDFKRDGSSAELVIKLPVSIA